MPAARSKSTAAKVARLPRRMRAKGMGSADLGAGYPLTALSRQEAARPVTAGVARSPGEAEDQACCRCAFPGSPRPSRWRNETRTEHLDRSPRRARVVAGKPRAAVDRGWPTASRRRHPVMHLLQVASNLAMSRFSFAGEPVAGANRNSTQSRLHGRKLTSIRRCAKLGRSYRRAGACRPRRLDLAVTVFRPGRCAAIRRSSSRPLPCDGRPPWTAILASRCGRLLRPYGAR